jgi:copper oxidase (laccase) domain-containing protein
VGCKIGVLVADCSAILISGPSRSYGNLVGAIHAGWRGTAKGIIASAISSLDLSHFRAWISPSICQEHFEVGAEVVRAFSDEYSEFAKEIGNGKFLFDLKAAQISELKKQGAEVFASSLCNFCQPEFVSYRRARGSLTERHLAWISRRS